MRLARRQVGAGTALRTRTKVTLLLAVLLAAALAAAVFVKVPYVILRPGPAPNTLGEFDGKRVLTVTGTKTYPTSGGLHFTTVSMYGGPGNRPSWLEYQFAKHEDGAEIYKESDLFAPETTREQVQQENQAQMTGSQSAAEVVAAREAGFTVPERIRIAAIAPKAEARKTLKVGDIITSVNGVTVKDSPALAAQMKKVSPGQKVKLGVTRGKEARTFEIPTTEADGRAVMGLALDPQASMPFKVAVSVGDVGGPSAGMMFTLAIYDEITPGPLTGGQQIAGTGTVDSTGAVGPIGGIPEKVIGARKAGATSFLAPADNCAELKGKVPSGITAYRVATIAEAIKTVKGIADHRTSGLPRCG